MKIKECKAIVKHILETKPHTRNSDNDLIVEVLNFIRPGIVYEPFNVVIKECRIDGRFPTLETIRRTRQKNTRALSGACADGRSRRVKTVSRTQVFRVCRTKKGIA